MEIVNRFKASFLAMFTIIFQLLPKTTIPLPQQPPPPPPPMVEQHNLDWAMIMIGFCLPSAVEIALQSLQIKSQLPPMFHFLCLAIIFSFTFLFVGKFVSSKLPLIARVLEGLGILFAVTAIFVAVAIPLPLWLKCVTWTLYALFLIAIIVCIISNHI